MTRPFLLRTAAALAFGLAATALPAQDSATPPAVPPGPLVASARDIALVRDALTSYRRGELGSGDSLRARVEKPGAGALLDWAALRFGGTAVAFDRVIAFATAYPDFPGEAWLRRRGEDALLVERKPGAVVKAYFARERPQSPAGKLALAQAFRTDGLDEDAAALIRDAWRNDIFGREIEVKILDAFKDVLTVADHRARVARFLGRENWEGARRAAGYAGESYGAVVAAVVAVDERARLGPKLVESVPAGLKAELPALFARVQLLRRQEKAPEAAKLLADVTRDPALLVDGDVWWVERRLIARKLLDDGDAKGAYAVVAGHGATSAERRVEAEFTAGWIALRFMSEPATALRHFDRAAALAATPTSQARAGYWQGRAAEQMGARDEAQRLYAGAAVHGITYYGQLAAMKAGRPLALRAAADRESPARLAAARLPLVEAVAVAYAAGGRDLALPLVLDFARGSDDLAELESVADIVAANSDVRTLLVLGKVATGRGMPLDEAAFPTTGIPAFEPLGPGVEPALIHAIARQESAFDPAAGSGAGARGLMQLMPGTAVATARKLGIPYQPGKILDPVYNAQLGSALLAELLDDYRGAFVLVFSAYNAGPGNAKKWVQAYGDPRDPGVDPLDWVERIPFSETRNYVQRVMENLQVYRRRLDPNATLTIEGDVKGTTPRAASAPPAIPTPPPKPGVDSEAGAGSPG